MVNFSRTKNFTKSNVREIPNNKTIVYKIKNNSSKTLYVGIAGRGRVEDRLMEYKEIKKEIIPGGTKFQFAQIKNKEIARKIEKQIIKKELPKFNDQNK